MDELSNTIENDPSYLKFINGEQDDEPAEDAPLTNNSKDTPLLEALRRRHRRRIEDQPPKQILARPQQNKPKKSRKKKQQQREYRDDHPSEIRKDNPAEQRSAPTKDILKGLKSKNVGGMSFKMPGK